MTNFDYKKYSLEQLENWIHDVVSSEEIPVQEIYETIKNLIKENYYFYKKNASRCHELLVFLNGDTKEDIEYTKKWIVPTEVDPLTEDVFITLPHDLMKQSELNEGDSIEWIYKEDNTWLIRKI